MIIVAHVGAGCHSRDKDRLNIRALESAILSAVQKSSSSQISAALLAEAAVVVLEDAPHTNAGVGCSLNSEGLAECDAVISASDGSVGAVGCLSCAKNPIRAAEAVRQRALAGPARSGLLPPTILAGAGADLFVKQKGVLYNPRIELVADLGTERSRAQWRRFERVARQKDAGSGTAETWRLAEEGGMSDTVGAVCLDAQDVLAAAASSGGNWLKHPGRLGPAAVPGAGVGVMDAVAVSTSGNGEHIVSRSLGLRLALAAELENPWDALREVEAGAIMLRRLGEDKAEISWAHSTPNMALGYFAPKTMKKPVIFTSRRLPGKRFSSGGCIINGYCKSGPLPKAI